LYYCGDVRIGRTASLRGYLNADHPDILRHAIDNTVSFTVRARNLSLVWKASSPDTGSVCSEEASARIFQYGGARHYGCARPDSWHLLHPMGFDLNGAWGLSALPIVDFNLRASPPRETRRPRVRIRRQSIHAGSRHISEWNANLIRARRSQPFPNNTEHGPSLDRFSA
jgi:hypothetical protein